MSSTNAFNNQQDTTATGKEQPGYLERVYNLASNVASSATNSASNAYNTTASNTDNTTDYRNQQSHVGGVGDLGTKHDADVSRLPEERAKPHPYTSGGTTEALENPNISDPNSIQQRLNARDPPNPYPEGNAGVGRTGDHQFRNQQDHVGGVGDLGTRSDADVVRLPDERANPNPLSSNAGNNNNANPFRETAAGTTGFGSTNRDTLGRDNDRGFDSTNNSGYDSTNRNRDHHTTAAGLTGAAAGLGAEREHHNRDKFDRDNNTTSNTGSSSSNRDNFGRDNTTGNTGFDSTNRDTFNRDNNSGFDSTTHHRDHHKSSNTADTVAAGAAAGGATAAGFNAERDHRNRDKFDRDNNTTSNTGFDSTNRDNFGRDNTTGNTGFDSTNRDTFNRDNNSGLDSTTHHRDHHKSSNTAETVAAGAGAAGATAAGFNAERDHRNRDRDNNSPGSHQWKPEQKSWDTGNVAGTVHDPTQHGHSGGVTGSNVDTDHGLGGPHRFDSERGNRDESALAGNNVAGATDFQSGREGAYNADSRDPLDNSGRQRVDTSDRGRHSLDAAHRDDREGAYNEGDDTTATSSFAKPGGPGKLDKLHGKIMVAKGKLTKDEESIAQGKRLQTEGVAVHPNDFLDERRE